MSLNFDQKRNFAYSVVATAPSPATSGTSLVVASGDGAKFPAAPFDAVVWPTGVEPTTLNAEVVRVTNIATDTLTIVRTQESSSNRSIVVNDQIAQNVTVKYLTDIEAAFQTASAAVNPVGVIQMWMTGTAPTGWVLLQGQNISRTTFAELFSLWGTTFGVGDGSTTFGVPDFQQFIPIGKAAAGTVSTLGAKTGSFDHTHASGTLTVASHTHGPGTLTVASHTHDSGTLQAASHTHGAGTFTVASHTHDLSVDTTFTDISHTHGIGSHTHTFSTGGPSATINVQNDVSEVAVPSATHTHSGTTDSSSGTTDSAGGSHRHSVSGQTTNATAPAVSSGLSASTAPAVNSGLTGATAPAVNAGVSAGTAPAVSSGATATSNPPVIAVNFIVRASSAI